MLWRRWLLGCRRRFGEEIRWLHEEVVGLLCALFDVGGEEDLVKLEVEGKGKVFVRMWIGKLQAVQLS